MVAAVVVRPAVCRYVAVPVDEALVDGVAAAAEADVPDVRVFVAVVELEVVSAPAQFFFYVAPVVAVDEGEAVGFASVERREAVDADAFGFSDVVEVDYAGVVAVEVVVGLAVGYAEAGAARLWAFRSGRCSFWSLRPLSCR